MASSIPHQPDDAELDEILDDALRDFNAVLGRAAAPQAAPEIRGVQIEEIEPAPPPSSSQQGTGLGFDPLRKRQGDQDPISSGVSAEVPAAGPNPKPSKFSGGTGLAFDPLKRAPGNRTSHQAKTGSTSGGSTSAGGASPSSTTAGAGASGVQAGPGVGPGGPFAGLERGFLGGAAVPPEVPDLAGIPPDMALGLQQLMAELANLGATPPGAPGWPAGDGPPPAGPGATLEALAQQLGDLNRSGGVLDEDGDANLLRKLTEQLDALGGSLGGGGPPGGGAGAGDPRDLTGLAETFMLGLLSKEVLYQPMKDIAERYPDWLDANRGSVEEAEFTNYELQYQLTQRIVTEFEKEGHQQEVIMNLLVEMQATGAPPQEIVSEVTHGIDFDGDGLPSIPGLGGGNADAANCCIQ